jgi:signal transduction histidine kinase
MRIRSKPFSLGRLSRRLLGAFFLIVAVLAVAGMTVATQITAMSIEARADRQLASDEAIVNLTFGETEEQVTFYSNLLADAEVLTDQLDHPTVTRSLTISLLSSVRRDRMSVELHRDEPASGESGSDLVRRGFLGIRATELTKAADGDGWNMRISSVSPVESTAGVERVVAVSYPLRAAYLTEIRQRIGADITLLFAAGHAISTLPRQDLARLLAELEASGSGGETGETLLLAGNFATGPVKTRVSPFRVNQRHEGRLLLTMPMGDLLAAQRTIYVKGLLVTTVMLLVAGLLYLPLIRRVTRPLEQLSDATRDIAEGNLDRRVAVHTGDEVEELAASFNSMVQRLKESRREIEAWNRTLEGRVEERTQSLQQTQLELEGVNEQLLRTVNELKETQDQLVQTEKLAAVGQMASAIAHEIKNPLAGIRAALDVVVPELHDNAYAEVLGQVIGQVDRLGRTISRLLGFARPAVPQRELISVRELVENTCLLVEQQARRHGVRIVLDLEPPDRRISLDPQLTTQAFVNIILNALQAMDGKGTLTISSRWLADQQVVKIAFADTGHGMTAEVRQKIFTPFFTTKRQGTGLGLYVVKDVIERQGGDVSVDSTPGEGTVVSTRLPVKQARQPVAGR